MKKVMKVLNKPNNKQVSGDRDVTTHREHAPIQPKTNKKTQAKALQVANMASSNQAHELQYDRKHSAGMIPGRRWKMLRSTNNSDRDRTGSTDQDSGMSCATTIPPRTQLHPSPKPGVNRLPRTKDSNVTSYVDKKLAGSSASKFYVPEEQDPLVLMVVNNQKSNQALTVEQCNKVSAAVAALDKNGSDLFARGEYQEAFLRFERALLLKRRSLRDQSLSWEKYDKHDKSSVLNKLGELERNAAVNTEEKMDATNAHRAGDVNRNPNSLSSLDLLKSHPTYKATEMISSKRNQNQQDESDIDEYNRTLIASVATSINNLTYLKQQNGQSSSEETLASYMQSLQMKLQVLGPDHLSVGKTLNNIGSVFYVQRKYKASLQAYLDAHCIMEAALGSENLDVATVASNIGDAYRCLGDSFDRALTYYRIALDIRWKLLPHDHPKVTRLMEQAAELELKEVDAATFLSPRRQSSFSDSDDDEVGGVENTTGSQIRSLKVATQQDMEFIEELERSSARDIVAEQEVISRELDKMRHESEKEVADLIRQIIANKDLLLAGSTSAENHQGKTLPQSMQTKPPNTNGEGEIGMMEHTIDTADLMQLHSTRKFTTPSRPVVSIRDSNLYTKYDNNRYEEKVVPNKHNDKKSSIPGTGPSSAPRLTREQRQLALVDVRERLAKLRASRDN